MSEAVLGGMSSESEVLVEPSRGEALTSVGALASAASAAPATQPLWEMEMNLEPPTEALDMAFTFRPPTPDHPKSTLLITIPPNRLAELCLNGRSFPARYIP